MTSKQKQTGSVKSFFVVAIILTCVLVGSIVYLKNRSDNIQIAKNNSTRKEVKKQDTAKSDKDTKKDSTSKTDTQTGTNTSSSTENTTSDNLPTTGPESTAFEAASLFMATFIVTSLLQSKVLKPVSCTNQDNKR